MKVGNSLIREQRNLYTVTIKDKTYGLTDVQVPKEQIGEKIGNIPVDCNVPECAAPPGNTFYQGKGKQERCGNVKLRRRNLLPMDKNKRSIRQQIRLPTIPAALLFLLQAITA
ncbi:hypothetical protein [Paenibacillus sp. ATY16]|uniref:hypothetical protein n=1 Tax=Paenibacillus sp. ATY16 TaxID=1759312 RepID=UPI0020108A17|nr:hypothetical protein [Paenibacillus sp. ATY16]MCK9861261.1 hypothetical protein [Paenibacillus sp. ATY16]